MFLYNCLTINKNSMLQILIQDMNVSFFPVQKIYNQIVHKENTDCTNLHIKQSQLVIKKEF